MTEAQDRAATMGGEARRLLNAARMVLDRAADGNDVSGEAAFVAQRIVDAIGHGPTDEEPARRVSIPSTWRLGAHGDPIAQFDYLHLRLHADGSVTWFSDAPSGSTRGGDA